MKRLAGHEEFDGSSIIGQMNKKAADLLARRFQFRRSFILYLILRREAIFSEAYNATGGSGGAGAVQFGQVHLVSSGYPPARRQASSWPVEDHRAS